MLLSGLALLVTGACGRGESHIHARDITGTWSGADGASITLSSDSTFQATGLSSDISPDQGAGAISGQGRWRLTPPDRGGGLPDVDLQFLSPGQVNLPLHVDRHGGALVLFAWIGDPDDDNRYSLRHG